MILQNEAAEEEGLSDDRDDGSGGGEAEGTESSDLADETDSTAALVSDESGTFDAEISEGDAAAEICVYICGAVASPGVYELPGGSRIWEAVEMAGGMTQDADERSVNLAQAMADGDMIFVPTVEESAAGVEGGTVAGAVDGGTAASDAGGTSSGSASDGKVNINTADVAELTTLNGIGDAKAEAIVAYRDEHGFFKSADEIMEVSGIGEGTYDKIKDYIVV